MTVVIVVVAFFLAPFAVVALCEFIAWLADNVVSMHPKKGDNALQRNGVRFSDYYDTSFTVTIKAKEN